MIKGEEIERIKKRMNLMDSLKRAVFGVHGFLSDFYEVKNKNYALAISTILGPLQYAIITNSQNIAFEAVQVCYS